MQWYLMWLRAAFLVTDPPFVHACEDTPLSYSCMRSLVQEQYFLSRPCQCSTHTELPTEHATTILHELQEMYEMPYISY